MSKHHEPAHTTAQAAAEREWTALTELGGHGTHREGGWFRLRVCRALTNTPPTSARAAERTREQRIDLALATASIGR
ncbi:hypothetical protein [Streptomyces sp. NPDC048606]|uniref:hypothetical protein n=1 Tax=Streptomyces sp. NPDC048606 TaxID=3154726 RepID=UPI00343B1D6F